MPGFVILSFAFGCRLQVKGFHVCRDVSRFMQLLLFVFFKTTSVRERKRGNVILLPESRYPLVALGLGYASELAGIQSI